MVYLLYCVVIACATGLGAVAGLAGGVIIKPLLDFVGVHDATSIGIYSCVAVFSMCVVSLAKLARGGFSFDDKVVAAMLSSARLVACGAASRLTRNVVCERKNEGESNSGARLPTSDDPIDGAAGNNRSQSACRAIQRTDLEDGVARHFLFPVHVIQELPVSCVFTPITIPRLVRC